jgi:two-component system NtrC family sensor kinase
MAETIALAPPMADHDAAFEEALRTRLKHLPFVRSLFVIGADGFITQDSNHSRAPRFGLADRDYFRVHQNDPAMGLHIGPPLVSRSLGRWFISMSRRISGPDGRFAGIAVAAVEPGYFERFYENLHLQAGDSIAMFRRDGTMLFRSPYSETVMGQSFPDHPVIRRLSERSEGSLRMVSVFDGVPRIVSYRAVDGLPLVVTVALAEAAVLSRWWQHATITLAGTTVAVALAATVYLLLARQARQRRALRERLARARGLEDLGRMTGGMAHDFNNILNVVSTNLESIRRVAVRERIPLSVDPARRAIDQGAKLISQLLAFARGQELTVRAV